MFKRYTLLTCTLILAACGDDESTPDDVFDAGSLVDAARPDAASALDSSFPTFDAALPSDAAALDGATLSDAATDAAQADTGVSDAGLDGAAPDAGDAGHDSGAPDAGDAGPADAGDAGPGDAGCQTFQTTGLDVTDPTLVTQDLEVTAQGDIRDVDVVNFKGAHNTMSQIDYIELASPGGIAIRLLNQGYCGTNDNWSYVFSDEGGTALPVSNTSPCGNGASYKPFAPLSAFYGQPAQGTWSIRIHDSSAGGSTSSPHLNSWGLRVCIE